MNVDISPNLPPMSSCTAAAPLGSGSDGGGSSTPSRSMRWIMRGPRFTSGVRRRPYPAVVAAHTAFRRLGDRNVVAEANPAGDDDLAPDAERDVALAAQRRQPLERGGVGGPGIGV